MFPSRTDTFGLVMLEALACGLPVAAFPVPGPRDVIGEAPVGVLDDDLRAAALARARPSTAAPCRAFAERKDWDAQRADVSRQCRDPAPPGIRLAPGSPRRDQPRLQQFRVLQFDKAHSKALGENSHHASDDFADREYVAETGTELGGNRNTRHRHVDHEAGAYRAVGEHYGGTRFFRNDPFVCPIVRQIVMLVLVEPVDLCREWGPPFPG